MAGFACAYFVVGWLWATVNAMCKKDGGTTCAVFLAQTVLWPVGIAALLSVIFLMVPALLIVRAHGYSVTKDECP